MINIIRVVELRNIVTSKLLMIKFSVHQYLRLAMKIRIRLELQKPEFNLKCGEKDQRIKIFNLSLR